MAIDVNKEVKVWGNLNKSELGIGAVIVAAWILSGFFFVFSVGLLFGAAWTGVGLAVILILIAYQGTKPKGYILGRLRYEGKFLFFTLPVKRAPAVYLPQCAQRADYVDAELEGESDGQ